MGCCFAELHAILFRKARHFAETPPAASARAFLSCKSGAVRYKSKLESSCRPVTRKIAMLSQPDVFSSLVARTATPKRSECRPGVGAAQHSPRSSPATAWPALLAVSSGHPSASSLRLPLLFGFFPLRGRVGYRLVGRQVDNGQVRRDQGVSRVLGRKDEGEQSGSISTSAEMSEASR